MERIDLKKLDIAITYLKRIAEGKNPLNNLPADEDSVLNNPNVIRCMYFVKDVLEEVKQNNGQIGGMETTKKKKSLRNFPIEVLSQYTYSEDKALTNFTNQINELIDTNVYQKVTYKVIQRWLIQNNYLEEQFVKEFDKLMKLPTEKGKAIGIRADEKTNGYGQKYITVIYNRQAQEFVVENMTSILQDSLHTSDGTASGDSYRYLDTLSPAAKELVVTHVENGETNLYHSLMSFIKNREGSSKEDIIKFYFNRYGGARPYLVQNRHLVEEIIDFCWRKIHP